MRGLGALVDFDEAAFAVAFDQAVGRCSELSREDAAHFVERGYAVVRGAFSKDIAAAVREQAWSELEGQHGVDRNDPSTWNRSFGFGGHVGYVRTQGSERRFTLCTDAPRAFGAQADMVGGAERLPGRGESLAWRDSAIGNLAGPEGPAWRPPSPQQRGWHKDGWHFRHFLNSPEQGLLTVPIFSDILPKSGGTFVAGDSIAPVARLLASLPEGLHPDSVQGAGFLIPGLIEQCTDFVELTGEAGDMVLLHPYMMHRVSANPTQRPRFIANAALVLAEPMHFDRPGGGYSLVELAVLRALGRNRLDYKTTRRPLAVKPGPFRDADEAARERRALRTQMRSLAKRGIVTPEWAPEQGYDSNRAQAGAP